MQDHGEFLIPLKNRGHSGATRQNFLYRWKNIYVMDNHRVAAWCWIQEIGQDDNFSIFHVDEHYDTLSSNMKSWLAHCENARTLSLQEYLDLRWQSGPHSLPVFQWDNYLSIFLKLFESQIQKMHFCDSKSW